MPRSVPDHAGRRSAATASHSKVYAPRDALQGPRQRAGSRAPVEQIVTLLGKGSMPREPMDLLQGTLDVLILRTLAWGPMHGYAVTRWIRERTQGTLDIEDAPLYKALHRLEQAGCVQAEWGLSENNRRARYYRLTTKGRQRFRVEESAWRRYAAAVFQVLEPT
jgi:PadR family transcriptional regulator